MHLHVFVTSDLASSVNYLLVLLEGHVRRHVLATSDLSSSVNYLLVLL